MFISSKKCFEIRQGDEKLVIPRNYVGTIPDWAAKHWLVKAAITDGSIATPDDTTDKAIEAADEKANKKAKCFNREPENESPKPKRE